VQKALAYAMRKDGLTPAIARATMLDNLAARGASDSAKAGAELLADASDHPRVRAAAVRTLSTGNPATAKRILLPLLSDPSRLVRYEAARVLASAGIYQTLSSGEQSQVDLALREVKDTLMVTADRAGAHMEWAAICEQRGHIPEAMESYETAISIEPTMAGPRTNLAALLDDLAQRGDARAQNRAQQLRSDELPLLARDAKLAPNIAVVQYRYGLALYLSGDLTNALKQLERAVELEPNAEDYQLAVRLLKEKIANGSND
jgi:tetratricopeptide (TPR) repeat protein